MNITIICVGKLKEKYWTEAVSEYGKRLSRYCTLVIEEIKEEKLAENAGKAEEDRTLEKEGERILKKIREEAFVVSLEIKGKEVTSEGLAGKLEELALTGKSDLVFVIGGSLGLSPEVSKRADFALSFSKMTFPHQMMRVILLEQIYRAFKILKNETYHK